MNKTKIVIIILSSIVALALFSGLLSTFLILLTDDSPAIAPVTQTESVGTQSGEVTDTEQSGTSGDTSDEEPVTSDKQTSSAPETDARLNYAQSRSLLLSGVGLDDYSKAVVSEGFVDYIVKAYGEDAVLTLAEELRGGGYTPQTWFEATESSVYALYALYTKAADCVFIGGSELDKMTFAFAGDMSLADNWDVMSYYGRRGQGLNGIVSPQLAELMRSYDVMAVNNEFCVSARGEPIDKTYTFRAKPENLSIYKQLGVDFVSLANNHVCDYGRDALLDTLSYLDDNYIAHAGAGKDEAEASKPVYYVINGRKIGILCGSRAEKNRITPVAGEDSAGVFGLYDSNAMVKAVKNAKAECDFVIVFAHWGKEDSSQIEDIIKRQAREYIDAGADVIVGAHAHQLQGMEFYNGKLIAYNLGNFLFEEGDLPTGILELTISTDLTYSARFAACRQKDCYTSLSVGTDRVKVLSYLRSLCPKVKISAYGDITEG